MCCTWLAENTGRKNDAKNRHLVLYNLQLVDVIEFYFKLEMYLFSLAFHSKSWYNVDCTTSYL